MSKQISQQVLNPKAVKPFKSTNFTLQTLMLLVFAFLEVVGFPIEVATELKIFIEATIFTAVGFWGTIREWLGKGINFAFNGNVMTYLLAFLSGVFPFLATYTDELSTGVLGLIEAIGSGNFTLIFTSLFAIGNIVWQIIQGRKQAELLEIR